MESNVGTLLREVQGSTCPLYTIPVGELAQFERQVTALLLFQLSLGLLVADFSAMVNNPHLSDVQFQMDNGEVLYAHKFVLYARCPLLIQYVSTW